MHFEVKMLENGRKYIFWDKQKKGNVPVMLLDVQVLTET